MHPHPKTNHQHTDEDAAEGEFLWLMSLSDLMILMFIFFVVMFSFSFKKLKSQDFLEIKQVITGAKQVMPLDETHKLLLRWIESHHLSNMIEITPINDSLVVEIKERILFAPGDYHIKSEVLPSLLPLSKIIDQLPANYNVAIEGHTDDTPLVINNFDANWELSSLRALMVLKAIHISNKAMKRVVLMAFGSYRPKAPTQNAKGESVASTKEANRRVSLRFMPKD